MVERMDLVAAAPFLPVSCVSGSLARVVGREGGGRRVHLPTMQKNASRFPGLMVFGGCGGFLEKDAVRAFRQRGLGWSGVLGNEEAGESNALNHLKRTQSGSPG